MGSQHRLVSVIERPRPEVRSPRPRLAGDGSARARDPNRHHNYADPCASSRQSAARSQPRGYPLHVHRPRFALRARGQDLGPPGLGDHPAHPHHARRRHHAPHPGPHRLHHRGADRAVASARPQADLPAHRRLPLALQDDEGGHRRGQDQGGPQQRLHAVLRHVRRGQLPARDHHGHRLRGADRPRRVYLEAGGPFRVRFISQDEHTRRSVEQTLEIAWDIFSMLPRGDLKLINERFIDKYLPEGPGGG